jgi:hypothetical protein
MQKIYEDNPKIESLVWKYKKWQEIKSSQSAPQNITE